jgi:hypothetical protein
VRDDGRAVRETVTEPSVLARRAEASGDHEAARRWYLVALEQHDQDPATMLALARLAERRGAPDEAREWYGRARRSELATAEVAQAWVQAELRLDAVERARAVLAEAAALLEDADRRLLAAAIAVCSGEHADALALVEPDLDRGLRWDNVPRYLLHALLSDRLTAPAAGTLVRDPVLFDAADAALVQLSSGIRAARSFDQEGARIRYRFAIEEPDGAEVAVGIARYCLVFQVFYHDKQEAREHIAALLASPRADLRALGRRLQDDLGRTMDNVIPD